MNRSKESGSHMKKISNCYRDRDHEELSFFRDMQKRGKDSLLQPVSDDFEPNGNYGLYRMESSGRKGPGLEFLAESGKNDYNWLKTPPATPLFPSLEMETNGKEIVVQRELPIIQPLSRFVGNGEGVNTGANKSTSDPIPKPKVPPRQTNKSTHNANGLIDKKNMKTSPHERSNYRKMNHTTTTYPQKIKPSSTPPVVKSLIHKESHQNFLASNLAKSMQSIEPKPNNFLASNLTKSMGVMETNSSTKSQSTRGVSPSMRRKAAAQIPGFSDETPSNLRTTNRPESATKGRPGPSNQNLSTPNKLGEFNAKTRRQACSPSVTRGRKVETTDIGNTVNQASASKVQNGSRTQVLGSKMVDKFMNARISGTEDRQAKIKLNGSMNETSGFGRLMSKNSLDMAIKHMEFQREPSNVPKHGMVLGSGRKS